MSIELKFELSKDNFVAAGEASSKIKQVLQQLGIKASITRRIAIAAYEAEVNVIIHADHGYIKAEIYPEYTELTVEDKGPGIVDIDLAMKEGYSTAPDYIREMGFGAGMGLPNMSKCSDEFSIKSQVGEGTKIGMMIRHQQ
jgi:anti-sigma regulatory factor (Ser/Thr protein kinase)